MIWCSEDEGVAFFHAFQNACHVVLQHAPPRSRRWHDAGQAAGAILNALIHNEKFFHIDISLAPASGNNLIHQKFCIPLLARTANNCHKSHTVCLLCHAVIKSVVHLMVPTAVTCAGVYEKHTRESIHASQGRWTDVKCPTAKLMDMPAQLYKCAPAGA